MDLENLFPANSPELSDVRARTCDVLNCLHSVWTLIFLTATVPLNALYGSATDPTSEEDKKSFLRGE